MQESFNGFFCVDFLIGNETAWQRFLQSWSRDCGAIACRLFSLPKFSEEQLPHELMKIASTNSPLALSYVTFPIRLTAGMTASRDDRIAVSNLCLQSVKTGDVYVFTVKFGRPPLWHRGFAAVRNWINRCLRRGPITCVVYVDYTTAVQLAMGAESQQELSLDPEALSEDEQELIDEAEQVQAEEWSAEQDPSLLLAATLFVELHRMGAVDVKRFERTVPQVCGILGGIDARTLTPESVSWLATRLVRLANSQSASE